MAKLKLNPEPTFKANVSIPVPGSAPVAVEFTFKYRTRTQLRDFAKAMGETDEDADEVALFKDFVSGWELDDAFNDENISRLLEAYPGASGELVSTYLRESSGVRRGN